MNECSLDIRRQKRLQVKMRWSGLAASGLELCNRPVERNRTAYVNALRDVWKNLAAGKGRNVSNSPIVQVHACVFTCTRGQILSASSHCTSPVLGLLFPPSVTIIHQKLKQALNGRQTGFGNRRETKRVLVKKREGRGGMGEGEMRAEWGFPALLCQGFPLCHLGCAGLDLPRRIPTY